MKSALACIMVIVTTSADTILGAQPSRDRSPSIVKPDHGWPYSAKTKEELNKASQTVGISAIRWNWFEHNGMQIGIAVATWPTDGESYIQVYGYVYNQYFKEWRQFSNVLIRNAGNVKVELDSKEKSLRVIGTANNDLKGKSILVWNLAALSDDRAYVR